MSFSASPFPATPTRPARRRHLWSAGFRDPRAARPSTLLPADLPPSRDSVADDLAEGDQFLRRLREAGL